MTAFNKFEYQNKVRDQKYDRIELIVPKGKKEEMQKRAEELGLFNKRNKPNVNEYIWKLVERDLEERPAAGTEEPDPVAGNMNAPE